MQWAAPGDSVLFKETNIECRLAYAADNTSYTLIAEAKLVGREIIAP